MSTGKEIAARVAAECGGVKTWQERINYGSLESVMQAEIDELRANARTDELLLEAAQAAAGRLQAENARLRDALEKAGDDIESWGAYASSYFQEKWNLQADIDAARTALGEKS